MPKEHKKRGRRDEQKKRKRDHDDPEASAKRRRKSVDEEAARHEEPYQDEAIDGVTRPGAMPFYGMLDEDEQEYFKRADEMLELNQFDGPEERSLFIESVYKEADGKELKMANSQSCSRLMERLILLSTPKQLKELFQKFNGHFVHLVQHRFASHCCEALFIKAAPVVTQEIAKPDIVNTPPSSDPNEIVTSMENLFLFTLDELEGYLGYLVTERFASHVLRVLLIVLAGVPLEKQNHKSSLHSKKKEKVAVPNSEKDPGHVLGQRKVPQSFLDALQKVITDSVVNLDTNYLQMLATHPTGNPTLQLMLKLELTLFGKSKAKDENSIIHKLLPDDPIKEDTPSAAFINGLVYDTVGSRLLETIIEHAPGKLFKSIYKQFFQQRMGSLARNEIAGYVAGCILARLSKDDLEEAMHQIVEQIPNLADRNRTAIIKTLIERCVARGVDTTPIAAQLEAAYGGSSGFEISRLLKLNEAPSEDGKSTSKHEHLQPDKVHGSLLAQTMMTVEGRLGNLIFDSFTNLGEHMTLRVARDAAASRTLQAALVSPNASVIFRRKVIQQFYGHCGELALDPVGSHVVDSIWEGTAGLAFIRERVAEELAENEASLRESHVGRAVWRNWRMDLYKRRRGDWVKQARYTAGNDGFQSFPEIGNLEISPKQSRKPGGHLSAIELARKKWADQQAAKTNPNFTEKTKKEHKKEGKKEKHEKYALTGHRRSSSSGKGKAKAGVVAH